MIAGCSIRLSTPPRLSARAKMSTAFQTCGAICRGRPSAMTVIMPPKPCIWRSARGRAADARAARDRSPARLADALLQPRARARARCCNGAPCAAPGSSAPRSARKRRRAPAMAPTAFCRKASARAERRCLADQRDAADDVGMAVQILVVGVHDDVEADARAAAARTGWRRCCRRRPGCRARARERATAARDRPASSSGLVGVSTQSMLRVGPDRRSRWRASRTCRRS